MNKVTCCENGVIADAAVYNRLQNAGSASILLLSDTHGAGNAVRWIFSTFSGECEVCLFAGDGAEDIFALVREAVSGVLSIPPVIIMAQGNCDCQRYPPVLPDDETAKAFELPVYQQIIIAHRRILLTHGHLNRVELDGRRLYFMAEQLKCTIAIHGHTHIQAIECFGSTALINPGSPLSPRGKSYGGFGILSINNVKRRGELRLYKLRQEGADSFSAAIHAKYAIPIDSCNNYTE